MVGGPACASAPGISQQAMAAACDERLQEEKMRCFTLTGDYRQAITPAGNVELFGALEVAQHIVRNYAQDVRGEKRSYDAFYKVFAVELMSCLGRSKYQKLLELGVLPLPAVNTIRKHMPRAEEVSGAISDQGWQTLVRAVVSTAEYQRATTKRERATYFRGHLAFDGVKLAQTGAIRRKSTERLLNFVPPVLNLQKDVQSSSEHGRRGSVADGECDTAPEAWGGPSGCTTHTVY